MGEFTDPRNASIDGLIDWLSAKRRRDPGAPLSDLLAEHQFDQHRLVDIACIDLMQRRRMEHAVTIESYVEEFPCLSSESNLLDLIDAELCIAKELGEKVEIEQYAHRFPDFADQVRELFLLEVRDESEMTSALIDISSVDSVDEAAAPSVDGELALSSRSSDFSIEALPDDATPQHQIKPLTEHPLDVPDWFVANQCVASGPGRWLIRGRDSVRGVALALKVTELPALMTASQSKQILDACEATAKVRNPCWVSPSIAAIQQRHLGVIRPWLFARPWQPYSAAQAVQVQLRNLAKVAFAIAAAHSLGATHGGIHLENLLIDHEGKVQILDAGSSRIGLERWLNTSDGHSDTDSFATLSRRKNMDTQDVIKLAAAASVEWEQDWARDLVADLRRIADKTPEEACGLIGQTMMRYADTQAPHRVSKSTSLDHQPSWRRRLAQWLTKNE